MLASLGTPAAAETTAQGIIDQFHRTLISVMTRACDLGYLGRFEALTPEIAGKVAAYEAEARGR